MAYLYLMKVSDTDGVYKIGATVNIEERIKRMEKAKDYKLECVKFIEVDGDFNKCTSIEQGIHRKLANYRLAGEWFALPENIFEGLFK